MKEMSKRMSGIVRNEAMLSSENKGNEKLCSRIKIKCIWDTRAGKRTF